LIVPKEAEEEAFSRALEKSRGRKIGKESIGGWNVHCRCI